MVVVSAWVYVGLILVVILFQAALAAGVPWGSASMGGKFPGKYPAPMRFVAILNILVLTFIAAIVSIKAGLLWPTLLPMSKVAIWGAVLFSAAGAVMNTITPSKIERIWAPVTWILLGTSIIVAVG
jgi:hypothetical protein